MEILCAYRRSKWVGRSQRSPLPRLAGSPVKTAFQPSFANRTTDWVRVAAAQLPPAKRPPLDSAVCIESFMSVYRPDIAPNRQGGAYINNSAARNHDEGSRYPGRQL